MAKWYVSAKKADFAAIGARFGIDQVTARIIRNRGVIGDDAVNEFLNGKISDIADPALLKDGQRLVDILAQKIADKAKIRIIGDYDIDGVMSTYILVKALKRAGACVDYMIPDRVKDGYGLNVHLIDKAYEDGIDTVVTCDNGIAAIKEIAHAKELGMTVLVTDHHAVPFDDIKGIKIYKESKADAIVNPHQIECSYPYKELCGAAVAWKIVILLYRKIGIDEKEAMDFIENVAFATVGDVMPLTGENRILVKAGLKSIHHTTNIGMKALLECCNIEAENVDAYHFGFVLGPCVNATGRLDTAKRALELFLCDRQEDAMRIASELVALNDDRKEMTAKGVETAVEIYERDNYEKDRVLVIYLPDVHESIAGIIAGRIREKYNKPTFILTKSEDGVKGCRRFLERVWKLQDILTDDEGYSADMETKMHQTIKKVSSDFESLKYNTAIAAMMSLINDFYKKNAVTKGEFKTLLTLLNPVAPHITEELWQANGFDGRLYQTSWPEYDEEKTVESTIELAVQINGKMKGTLKVSKDEQKDNILAMAKEMLGDKLTGTIVKEIYVPGRIVNIVVKP